MTATGQTVRVVVVAGGVGGARMARGFAACEGLDLRVVVNVGDDDWFHGLRVCPDLDTVLYTLAGVVSASQGWGVEGDGQRGIEMLRTLDAPDTWMQLGDADLAVHIHRTQRLAQGERLTQVTGHLARRFGVAAHLLPASDAECPTVVQTDEGRMRFQEWFVKARGAPRLRALDLSASGRATVTDEVRQAVAAADLIVIAPSNPILSIEPILALRGMRELLCESNAVRIAISPLIGGRAVKGPLTKLMGDLGLDVSLEVIMDRYRGLIDAFVLDESDSSHLERLSAKSEVELLAFPTLIAELSNARRLAEHVLAWADARPEAGAP